MAQAEDLDAVAAKLEATGQYRVLRRLLPRSLYGYSEGSPTRLGAFIDVETTGLNPNVDEIIELAVVPFLYSIDGRVLCVGEPYQQFAQPSRPIPPGITRLTGIDDNMVAGRQIDIPRLETMMEPVTLVVAHNAKFDRPFLERLTDVFAKKAWGCSMAEVDWHAEGFAGTKLAYLAAGHGLFFDAHRATNDCLAAIEILARPLPKSGMTALAQLLTCARETTSRIWATQAPIESKDRLKSRGYRWNPGDDGRPRAWYGDVAEPNLEEELRFLQEEIYGYEADPLVTKITAYERYSDRA